MDFDDLEDSEDIYEAVPVEPAPRNELWANAGVWIGVGLVFLAGAAIYSFIARRS